MGRGWSERVVEAKLMHYLDSSYHGSGRTDRYRTATVRLARPSGAVYSTTATVTCDTCGQQVDYRVLSVLASRLRFALWAVLALVGAAIAVWGVVVLFADDRPVEQGDDPPGIWLMMLGLVVLSVFALLLVTEIGISGPGARRTARPHNLQLAREPLADGAMTCEHCGHQEPFDAGGYARMRQHRCR